MNLISNGSLISVKQDQTGRQMLCFKYKARHTQFNVKTEGE